MGIRCNSVVVECFVVKCVDVGYVVVFVRLLLLKASDFLLLKSSVFVNSII